MLHSPLVRSVGQQFVPLVFRWCLPSRTPVESGGIVSCLQGGQVVGEAIVAVFGLAAVLCQFVRIAVGVFVSTLVVGGFCADFAPCVIVAVAFGLVGAYVACGP